jgi:hypothetical protein
MIIDNLNIKRITIMPLETNTPLLVNADSVFSFSISLQRVKLVAGIEHQRFKAWSGMENHKPFSCLPFERLETADALVVEQLFGISTGK